MPTSIVPPDLRNILGDLARRIGILERRVNPRAEADASKHTHDGTGPNSVLVHETAEVVAAEASGDQSVAVGARANASGESAVAVGFNARSLDTESTAVGAAALANDVDATAVGANSDASQVKATAIGAEASAGYAFSTAIGYGAQTTNDDQIVLGLANGYSRTIQGVPDGAIASADLGTSQMSFYLNEAGDLLTVKVKYGNGTTVKTGTIALV